MNNAAALDAIESKYNSLLDDSGISRVTVKIRGNASVEGDVNYSNSLANNRASAIAGFLVDSCNVSKSSIVILPSLPVKDEALNLLNALAPTRPELHIDTIIQMVNDIDGAHLARAVKSIDKGSSHPHWDWFAHYVLAPTRYAEIIICYEISAVKTAAAIAPVPVQTAEPVANAPPSAEPEVPAEPVPEPDPEPEREYRRSEVRIGTNLLYDVATVANLSLEVGFAQNFAFNVMATFSPWDIVTPTVKLRTLLIQPELRYYFAKDFKGHYLGVEGHYGWYNVALGGKTRYQDRDGQTPLWGAGLSYGYVLAFNRHWGMDFGISVGYAHLDYDCFYNIENGAKYTSSTYDWWGPTRAGISIYYQF